ncbi:MAG TPA: tetratricopeptide repeat-containing protein [Pyrinomonadaceae bacterium]|nr:tetratricopeptide repeat-containing protein [Pyrinomonadaceae bacterium]
MNRPENGSAQSARGRIITFYSYKGGTGRSMALANVAWVLASAGKRVLTVDWDLEAPGLHRYFFPFIADKELSGTDGLINFVHDYKVKALSPPTSQPEGPEPWYAEHADIRDYSMALRWDGFPRGGGIDFVPAGRQDESYSELVNFLNWKDFYERLGGSQFFEEAAAQMRRNYDYVLIDSRTGVSDTSGICTVKLPDALAVCFTLNNQSINGASGVADFVLRQRPNDIEIYPVQTRIEFAEEQMLREMQLYARERFDQFPNRLPPELTTADEYWERAQVPYVPFYAYREILAAFGRTDALSMLAAVERLTSYLTKGEVSKLSMPEESSISLQDVLAAYAGDTEATLSKGDRQNRIAENAYTQLNPEDQQRARRALLRLVTVGQPNDIQGDKRRRLPVEHFRGDTQPLLRRLSEARLLRLTAEGGVDTVEIADDEMLRGWRRLRGWLDEGRTFLLWRQELETDLERWLRSGREEDLLRGSKLDLASQQLQRYHDDLGVGERRFINESLRRARPEPVAEKGAAWSGSTPGAEAALMRESVEVLRGAYKPPADLLKLAKRLKAVKQFGLARRLLARARRDPAINADSALRLTVYQQSALCTYKDSDLPADGRLDRALEILREADDLAQTRNQETLGLAGAIYKRKWELDNQRAQLERSLFYYLRGYAEGVESDQGYTGINAAFILDLLAHQELDEALRAGAAPESEERRRIYARRLQAANIRRHVAERVEAMLKEPRNDWLQGQWWFYATMAEAYFGLGSLDSDNYEKAVSWLERGRDAVRDVPEWEFESLARQLAWIARIQTPSGVRGKELENTPAWVALARFLGRTAPVRSAFNGKIGLGLSGGGFRASLYHIGVLAKLAELDVLRQVEVLSCVSGGSIVGAHYYLEVRKLLEEKTDEEITREDYIELVKRVQRDFLAGVQRNVRTRVAAEPVTNLRMIFSSKYSRTLRAGELFESEIFSRVEDGGGKAKRFLNKLRITPKGEGPDFRPKYHNWRRVAKVPILILNAATLNTGHSWHFTASYMGEPPAGIDSNIDGNDRFRRMYYEEAPEPYRNVRLGTAVAASACVPGLFDPVALPGLYPDRVVRLVDGGTCDNQGVGGLLEQDCNVLLLSDGSGQMESVRDPSAGPLGVALRSTSIIQARVRQAQYQELASRRRSQLTRGLMFVHLKEDLDVDPIDWIDCPDPYDADDDDARPPSRRGPLTRYGVAKELQQKLAAVRTDLDSFSDVEAFALMTSAYRMTEHAFAQERCVEGFEQEAPPEPWEFLQVEGGMKGVGKPYKHVSRLLAVSDTLAFKIWKLKKSLQYVAVVLALAILVGGGWAVIRWWEKELVQAITVGALCTMVLSMALTALGTALVSKKLMRVVRLRETLRRAAVGVFVGLFGWLAARLHLYVFDPMFLREGSIKRYPGAGDPEHAPAQAVAAGD